MSDDTEKPGTFVWATAQLDKRNKEREAARVEYEAIVAAERELEERKANSVNLTHEELVAEVVTLRERIAELETELEELEEWKRGVLRAIGGDPVDW